MHLPVPNHSVKLEKVLRLSIEYRESINDKEISGQLSDTCDELCQLEPSPAESVTYSSKLNKTNADPDSEYASNIICIKCGGQLMTDKRRSLFECRSCGVAYGTSLFFGEANKKAKEALVKHDFSEADQRYSYMLMIDPHDFEALRGRVLCAAKWSRPKVENRITHFWVNNFRSRIEYALGEALDEDKPYFEKYIEMMNEYSSILEFDNKLATLKRQHKECLVKRDNIEVDYDPDEEEHTKPVYAHKTIIGTITGIEKEINVAEYKR